MRNDMKRVIITPPRYKGYSNGKHRASNCDVEELPMKESMRKKHLAGYGGKEFNDFIAPLRRFLEKNTNRPWDKVYSEICEHADVRSVNGWHLRQHVEFIVYQNIQVEKDGTVYRMDYSSRPFELWYGSLYVCPKTGLLKKYERGDRGHWWKKKVKFDCLEAKVAYYTPDVKYHFRHPTKYCTLEYTDGTLWALFWKDNEEFVVRQKAAANHADMMLEDNVYRIIRGNLKSALISDNPCIREMGRLVKKSEDIKTAEIERKQERLDTTLSIDKKQRKILKKLAKQKKTA